MKKARMVKALFAACLLSAISVGAVGVLGVVGVASAEADVQPLGIATEVSVIKDTVPIRQPATYNISVKRMSDGPEYVNFSIKPKRHRWTYEFNPEGFFLNRSGETNYSILGITPPVHTSSGHYYHDLNATAYIPGMEWLGVVEISGVNISMNVTGSVGGTAVPVSKLGLLAPWIGLAAVLVFAVVATVALGRHKKKRL